MQIKKYQKIVCAYGLVIIIMSTWFLQQNKIPSASAATLDNKDIVLHDGMLISLNTTSPVYYLEQGKKRPFISMGVLQAQGFGLRDIITVSDIELGQYPDGEPVIEGSNISLASELPILPDLTPFPASDLRLVKQKDKTILKFTSIFWNKGKGPLELITNSNDPNSPNDYRDTFKHILESNGTYHNIIANNNNPDSAERITFQHIMRPDGTYRNTIVGLFVWHEAHKHYHYSDFADYEFGEAKPDPNLPPPEPIITKKSTFCMRDSQPANIGAPAAKRTNPFTTCNKYRQGVSPGWADKYPYTLSDQYIDVTNVPAGIYRLSFIVDPRHHFVESNQNDNTSVVLIDLDIKKGKMKVLASGSAFATTQNKFSNGMLLKTSEDNAIYIIRNNKKRRLFTSEVLDSYGYNASMAYEMPKSIIDAIPQDGMIRVKGTNDIYRINAAGYRRLIHNPGVVSSYKTDVAEVTQAELDSYAETNLIMRSNDKNIYLITGNYKQNIGLRSSPDNLLYNFSSVHLVNKQDFDSYYNTTVPDTSKRVEIFANSLTVPWDIVFLPDGDMLVTERIGTIRRIGKNPTTISLPSVTHVGEGGLMGIALHPNYAQNQFVYLYFTTTNNGKTNQVSRFRLKDNQLIDEKIIIGGIPGSLYHDGGQIAFGPDNMLYITTGDAENPKLSQDLDSLSGKTLRLTSEGDIPADNPFGTAVWSYGHRNAQGIAWDDKGRMWQTEHGRSGALSGFDELNLVEKGKNYGWPTIQGNEKKEGMVTPILNSGATTTWAPSGLAYLNGKLFFAGLLGSALYELTVGDQTASSNLIINLKNSYGRLRAVVVGPDGLLYITTSNRDGRGTVRAGDDKILKVNPELLR